LHISITVELGEPTPEPLTPPDLDALGERADDDPERHELDRRRQIGFRMETK
jgi:hypothetical protein